MLLDGLLKDKHNPAPADQPTKADYAHTRKDSAHPAAQSDQDLNTVPCHHHSNGDDCNTTRILHRRTGPQIAGNRPGVSSQLIHNIWS